jgi:ubiquinone/menaquinone biosynthesis C-methylase UbiE
MADNLVEYNYAYQPIEGPDITIGRSIAEIRKSLAPFRFKLAAREITHELGLDINQKVLEIGCGLGLLGSAIKNEIEGKIDYFAVELAYKSALNSQDKNIITPQASAENLPFAGNSFDAIVSTDVLEHVPNASNTAKEIFRVLKPGAKAFITIADPSEARFDQVEGHINRTSGTSNVEYWQNLFEVNGLKVLSENSEKYRSRDWRKIFNLPILVKLKNKPGFACAFNPINRPGTYILQKPEIN